MNAPKNPVIVRQHGDDIKVVSPETLRVWLSLIGYTLTQVWTWRGGEAIVGINFAANYGRGETRAVVRTGGTKRGPIRILCATSFKDAMDQIGIPFRNQVRTIVRRPLSEREALRQTIARHARKRGNIYRTIRARPTRRTREQSLAASLGMMSLRPSAPAIGAAA